MRTIGQKMRVLREKHALSLDEMANHLCLSPQYYAAIEAGFLEAPSAVLDAFALVLGIPVDDITATPCSGCDCSNTGIYDMLGLFSGRSVSVSMDRA